MKKIFSRNLAILSIVIRGQSAIIDNVRREQRVTAQGGRADGCDNSVTDPFSKKFEIPS